MAVDLPMTWNLPARELAKYIDREQLGRGIAYLELVRARKIKPGVEIENLLGVDREIGTGDMKYAHLGKDWTIWVENDLEAVQRKLALAICISKRVGYKISEEIRESITRHCIEVLRAYNEGGHRGFGRDI